MQINTIEQINHDIKSNITSVKAYLQLIQKKSKEPAVVQYTMKMDQQMNIITAMITELVTLYHKTQR